MAASETLFARRYRFWRASLVTGTKATLGFFGLLGIAIGGSAVAYWQFAGHRPLVVILGAVAAMLVLMEAAYRRWDGADKEAAELRAERARAEVGSKHHARLESSFSSFTEAVARADACDFGEEHDSSAIKAHFPLLVSALGDWNSVIAAERNAPAPLRALIRAEAEDRGLPEVYLDSIAERLLRLTVELNGATNHRLEIISFADGPPEQEKDRWTLMLGQNPLLVIDGTSPEDVEQATVALQETFTAAQESEEAAAIVQAREAREALRDPIKQELQIHATIHPVLVADDCLYCQAQAQARAA
jgi:hypothetical protein